MSIVTFHSLFSQKCLQLQPKQKHKGTFTHRETTYYRALNYELLGSSSIACLKIRLPAYFHKFRQKMERKCSIFVRFIFYYNMIFLFRSHYFFPNHFDLLVWKQTIKSTYVYYHNLFFRAVQILGLNACRKASWQALNDSSIVLHYYREARWELWFIKLKIRWSHDHLHGASE